VKQDRQKRAARIRRSGQDSQMMTEKERTAGTGQLEQDRLRRTGRKRMA
jgi:hypothetical protein